jgi:hypothetical protein
MNALFSAAIEAELATIERVVAVSTASPGWGGDLSCTDDFAEDFAELEGDDPLVVAQYAYRGLCTDGERGELADDPDWGISLEKMLSKGMTAKALLDVRSTVRGQIARDDRLTNVVVQGTWDPGTEALTLVISDEIADSGDSFSLTVVVDATGMNLVELLINGRTVPES